MLGQRYHFVVNPEEPRYLFLVNPEHKQAFEKKIKKELRLLQENNIPYTIREDRAALTVWMFDERDTAYVGLYDIKSALQRRISNQVSQK